MEPITDGNMLHFVAPVTIAQLVDVKAAIKAGHPPGTLVDLRIENLSPGVQRVLVEIVKPGAAKWCANFGVHEPQAAP
jgi:hypothetical protein